MLHGIEKKKSNSAAHGGESRHNTFTHRTTNFAKCKVFIISNSIWTLGGGDHCAVFIYLVTTWRQEEFLPSSMVAIMTGDTRMTLSLTQAILAKTSSLNQWILGLRIAEHHQRQYRDQKYFTSNSQAGLLFAECRWPWSLFGPLLLGLGDADCCMLLVQVGDM